ncbi:uncharacterized protein LOC127103151 [Lathyrus oleraceus]|uniref:uncharacterized protein LOC127103151 n=1 Tax=Pisum sativum TaxID=3888 RepID=UPI0021D2ABCC|nr:uncharacterized protein LOC127103151 [Pisum sativum]
MDYLDVVTDVIPLSMVPRHVPTKRRARTHTGKKVRPSTVSKSSNPYGSVQILSSEIRNIDPSVAVKKPHYMNNLYLGPIKTTNVEPDVVASAKGSIVPKAVGSVESTEKPEFEKPESDSGIVSIDNPRSDKTLGQSSINDADKNIVDKIISVLISQILGIESNSDVVSDVTTSLAQTDHSIETLPEKYDGKSNSESVIVKSPKKYKEKDDSNCMFVDISDKEENVGVKKDQSTYIVNVEDLDSDDESIGKRLAIGVAKRLKSRKGKVVKSISKYPKAPNKSTSVGPAKRWSKVVTIATKKRSLKRKKVPYSSSDYDYDVEQNVQYIMPLKKSSGKKVPINVPEVPIDNIYFDSVENVEKWKFVYQRRLALERELGKDAFECKEVMDLIKEVGLMKSVSGFGKCYKMLVKEFIVNISNKCDNKRSKEFKKVYVR